MTRKAAYNSTYPKGGFSCSKDSFVVYQTLVFQTKFCAKNPALRVAANRYSQLPRTRIRTKMDDEKMKKEWDAFAKSIGGAVDATKANYLDRDNYYKIKTDNGEIELTWGNQPQRGRGPYVTLESRLRFRLKNKSTTTLSVRPKHFFSIFSSKKQKFGVAELDKAYSFSSNSAGLAYDLTDLFKDFYKNNHYKNFVIETENITDVPTLTIFIPELLTTKDKLTFYYNFGLKVSKKITADT